MNTHEALRGADLLSLVPAGGKGERLGVLTAKRAKPALATSFDNEGNIQRMIDIPLGAIRHVGGAALVTTLFASETLDFVNTYPFAITKRELTIGSPIDSLIAELELLKSSRASIVGIVPADACIEPEIFEEMQCQLERSSANALILASHHLDGHNVWSVDRHGMMTDSSHQADVVADLGIHLFKKDWLLERLTDCMNELEVSSIDIWKHLYCIDQPAAGLLLYVPKRDPVAVDMGTGSTFYKIVYRLNQKHADSSENIIFPSAALMHGSVNTIALPGSSAAIPLQRAIIPEECTAIEKLQTLQCE